MNLLMFTIDFFESTVQQKRDVATRMRNVSLGQVLRCTSGIFSDISTICYFCRLQNHLPGDTWTIFILECGFEPKSFKGIYSDSSLVRKIRGTECWEILAKPGHVWCTSIVRLIDIVVIILRKYTSAVALYHKHKKVLQERQMNWNIPQCVRFNLLTSHAQIANDINS